ncbi:MAG: haloacid dehalogenase type II [Candidatus Zixiibacteriota bacterium]
MDWKRTKALTFDCYGTLIDWESGILAVLRPWASRQGIRLTDEELLAVYARAEPEVEKQFPTRRYSELLGDVMRHIGEDLRCAVSDEEAARLAHSVGDWPAFPDTPAALRRLQERFRLVIVSNVDRDSFSRTNQHLGVTFDAIITAEEVGAYKPDHRMFLRAWDVLFGMGIDRAECVHVAQSLYHDHVPVKALGGQSVWVDRRQGRPGGATAAPGVEVQPDLRVASLSELADLVECS